MLIKTYKEKRYFEENQFDNILRLFDLLQNFNFTTSEPMVDYYISGSYIGVASRDAEGLQTSKLIKLGNIRKVSKLHRRTS